MTAISIVGYLILFAGAGFLFLFGALLVGRLLRPRAPQPAKLETSECGEPAIGSGFVQFDLRFYVVALVFLIFEVEVAFFFPWATVFGKAAQLAHEPDLVQAAAPEPTSPTSAPAVRLSKAAEKRLNDLAVREPRVPDPTASPQANSRAIETAARRLAGMAMADIAVFFGVLLVGFAYVWRRGDLDWVRALPRQPEGTVENPLPVSVAAMVR